MTDSPFLTPREKLAPLLAAERAAGRRVVLCNGVFDLLHPGHIRVLRAARECGELLVVAINDDASTERAKGPGHPLQGLEARAEILAALRSVDFVTPFPEDTVAETLRILRPAIHAKGEDYDPRAMPPEEARIAAELGVRQVFVGGPKIASSRELATRLSREAR